MDIKGQAALVTGAGSGIGRATAMALARAGAAVIATDVDAAGLAALGAEAQTAGWALSTERLDVTDRAAWQALFAKLSAAGQTIAILVNNAGIGYFGSAFETPRWAFDKIIAVNVMGVVNGCEVFGPAMVASKRPAAIVNVASAASANPIPNLSAYSASKFAVEGYSDVLAMELAESKVAVVTVHPGIIDTAIVHDPKAVAPSISAAQMQRIQTYYRTKGCAPDVVAKAIVDAVRTGRAKVFAGPLAGLSGWMRRLAPVGLKRRMTRQTARQIGYLV